MRRIKLDILSDPICPWCLIGKVKLDAALAAHPDHPFDIEWHPRQLNPDMPKGGMDRAEYLELKFGGKAGAIRAYAPIVERAEAMGLGIDFAAITRTPNTLDAHRVIHWAGLEGRQGAVVAALFAAYFQQGRDIGAQAVLAEIAASAGLDGAMIAELLASDADKDEVHARDAHALKSGVTGVPTFVVGSNHVVTGAQPAALWANVIAEHGERAGVVP